MRTVILFYTDHNSLNPPPHSVPDFLRAKRNNIKVLFIIVLSLERVEYDWTIPGIQLRVEFVELETRIPSKQ